MKKLRSIFVIATIVLLVVVAIAGPLAMQRAAASATNPLLYPYNQATSVTYNIADVTAAWTAYKNARVTTNGAQGGVRVLWDDSSSTVSEGMGYGMLFTVIFDEQSNFDGMWKYVSQHLDANGLMDWKIDSSGTATGTGAATDGDEDMALALVNACVKTQKGAWPASPSGYNYCTLATSMINNIYNTEIDKAGSAPAAGLSNNPGGELIPGDTWSLSTTYPSGIVNLSYFSPGYYTVFGKFTNNVSGWEAVNTRNYAITNLAQSKSGNCSKLVPNWATYNGDAQSVSWQTNEYGWWSWDAARFAFRVAVDKAWYNTANAQESMNEVGGFFSSVGISNVKAQYKLDGTSVDSYDSAFFNANAAAAIWAAPAPIAVNCGAATATLKTTPQQAYDRLLAINDATSYYPAAWRLFGILLMTGNFPNVYELGNATTSATATNTRTSTVTNTPVITNTRTSTPTVTRTSTITNTPVITNTVTKTPTTGCILPTQERLLVSPVTSPTTATTQVINVTLNNGISVSVTGPAGTFTSTTKVGSVFSVTVNLVANSTNTLQVQGTVQVSPGCTYVLSTSKDSNGAALSIVQGTAVTLTPTATPTRTLTPTVTPIVVGGTCSPVTSTITAPFSYDGAGTFCWQASTLATYINSWNMTSLTVNGTNYTNLWAAVSSLPAKIGGYWYISYNGPFAWSHFEAK